MSERIALRLITATIDGHKRRVFQAADDLSAERLRQRKIAPDDVVFAEIKQARNPRFHRLAHQFGKLVTENLDKFEGMTAHKALKRLQAESGIGCEEVGIQIHGMTAIARWPLSLSFESMDEGKFREVFSGLCEYVAKTYWPDCTAEEIEQMAAAMPEVA